jgi:predicted N-acyltransferase
MGIQYPATKLDPQPIAKSAFPNGVVRTLPSISHIARGDWDRLFPGRAEGWDYFNACEQARPEGFSTSALGLFAGDMLVAAAPLFRSNYNLDIPASGALKPIGHWIGRCFPKLLNMPILGMGSPLTEECPLGFLPGLRETERQAALSALMSGMSAHARSNGTSILTLKDVTDRDDEWLRKPMADAGFVRVPTLPIATLHLPHKSEQDYLASLSSSMRSDIRKKMRALEHVQVSFIEDARMADDEIVALFQETKAKRKVDYAEMDEVPDAYFREVLGGLGGRAKIMIMRVKGEIACFSLFLEERNRIIGKYVGMRYPLAREYNLYFLNWMLIVRRCIENGIEWLQAGQTTYQQKMRLGCRFKRSWLYFKHEGAVMGPLFRAFGPLMSFDSLDPDLRALGDNAPYWPTGQAA